MGRLSELGRALALLAPLGNAFPQAAQGPDTSTVSTTSALTASQVVVTATTGDHPVVTFMPSQDPKYSTVTETTTTTDQNNNTILIFPFGVIWVPIEPIPIPPEVPTDMIPKYPRKTGDKSCKTFSTPAPCTKTISYISESTGFTSTETGLCLPDRGCVLGTTHTTTSTIETSVPWAAAVPKPTGHVPEPNSPVDPDTQEWFSDMYKRLGIGRENYMPDPVCQESKLSAPQREEDGSPDVSSKVEEWCSEMDGETVTISSEGVDTVFERFDSGFHSFWLSANNWYYSPFDCGPHSTISKEVCQETLNDAMIICDPDSGITHGASMVSKCIQYNITLSHGTDPQSPPWNPIHSPQCDGSTSGVFYTFFEALAPVFCNAADESEDSHFSKVLTNHDLPDDDSIRRFDELKKRTPPPSPNSYDGFKFEFNWDARDDGGGCRASCKDAYNRIVQRCGYGGGLQNAMSLRGSMDVGCGTYSYSISKAPPRPEPSYTTLKATAPTAPVACYWNEPACHYKDADPDTAHDKTDTFCDDHFDYTGYRNWEGITDDSNDFFQDNSWNFRVLWKKDCVDPDSTYLKLGQPIPSFSCQDAMRMTFDGCTTNGGRGGKVEVGCMEYYFNVVNRAHFGQETGHCLDPWGPFES